MKWLSEMFTKLAEKVKATQAFAIIFGVAMIIALAIYGDKIPVYFRVLIYIVVIGVLGLVIALEIFTAWSRRPKQGGVPDVKPEPPPQEDPKPSPDPAAPIPDPPDDYFSAREAYLRAIVADCRGMRLVGLDPQAGDPSRGGMGMEALYISLDTTTPAPTENRAGGESKDRERLSFALEREQNRPLSALEALTNSLGGRMVLLGLPGAGKSTFVRYLALGMAKAGLQSQTDLQESLQDWQGSVLLPIMISLGRLAETLPVDLKKGRAQLIEEYLVAGLKNDPRTTSFAPYILDSLAKSGGLVFFDGLDEVANLKLRPVVVQAVEDFVGRYGARKENRFLVTCRTWSYQDPNWQLTGWPTHELALFDESKIEHFVQAWHDELIHIEPGRKVEYNRKRERLLNSLQADDRRKLYEVAPNPLILTMMAIVHSYYGELPDTRAQVYEKCVDLLLVRWDPLRPITDRSEQPLRPTIVDAMDGQRVSLDRALVEIAYKAHEGRTDSEGKERNTALVTEDLLTATLPRYFDPAKVQTFLEYCQSSNGLLMYQGTIALPDEPPDAPRHRIYAFPHMTFEEYLAALYLVSLRNFARTARDLYRGNDRWREVILLLGEHLCFASKPPGIEPMQTLLSTLAPEKAPQSMTEADWRSFWLAGDLLILYRRAFPNEQAPADERIIQGMVALVRSSALELRERAAAADTLDELGWQPGDQDKMVKIEAGEQAFFIGRYPVTNAQYERFLRAENFSEESRDLWTSFLRFDEHSNPMKIFKEDGWKWLQETQTEQDESPQGKIIYPRFWRDPRFGISRCSAPVVGISWWEANAYCNWLIKNWSVLPEGEITSGKVPQCIRLPVENEWILAAGGLEPEGRYPWDKEKATEEPDAILLRANTRESNIGRTTPVWMYPGGASEPWQVMDLSGNVWEWQANFADKDHDVMALRGGSWFLSRSDARVAVRFGRHPIYGSYYIGFRVVVLP